MTLNQSSKDLSATTRFRLATRELERRTKAAVLDSLYPDEGPLRRELYIKHMKMFEAGAKHDERVCLGGNRVGKTLSIGGYETALHLTGLYPHWWPGRRYDKPIITWAPPARNQPRSAM